MVFSEPAFLFVFLPLLLGAYFVVPKRLRNLLLLGASLAFYAWGEKFFVAVMLTSIAFNYAIGLWVGRTQGTGWSKVALTVGIMGDLGLLIAYKYANFLADNLNLLLSSLGLEPIELGPVHLPIGISFFTFQAMSYVVDVYRRNVPAQKNPIDIALYISMFPQLIAGPIVRYRDVAAQILHRTVTQDRFASGVRRFVIGLGKKVLIANTVAWPVDMIFDIPGDQLTIGLAWLGVVCYMLQIYFDFSGYSDMAIGLGRMFGFEFMENFNYPYIARSMTDFWRRWHISLSTWYRDYLYVPLGGNRCKPIRVYLNLLIVFFLCGLWHGASWSFVAWGLFHGAFLIIERAGRNKTIKVPSVLNHLYVLIVVLVGWTLFRAETLETAITFLLAMVGLAQGTGVQYHVSMYVDTHLMLALTAGAIGSTPILPTVINWCNRRIVQEEEAARSQRTDIAIQLAGVAGIAVIMLVCAMYVAASTYNPFIYFRF